MSKELFLKQNMKPDETHAGLILGKDGQLDHHLFLLPAKPEKNMNWNDAMQWARSVGGNLPTRNEQSLLFANCKEEFKPNWYWSNEQYAYGPDYAWMQYFNSGDQNDGRKWDEYSARAVRRIYIEELK